MERATELEYLRYFRETCDFGPAHDDVIEIINDNFRKTTRKDIPEEWEDKW
jgi:hypothetical protein